MNHQPNHGHRPPRPAAWWEAYFPGKGTYLMVLGSLAVLALVNRITGAYNSSSFAWWLLVGTGLGALIWALWGWVGIRTREAADQRWRDNRRVE